MDGDEPDLVGPVLLGPGCEIGDDVRIDGPTVIGDRVRVGDGARLKEVIALPGAEIPAAVLSAPSPLPAADAQDGARGRVPVPLLRNSPPLPFAAGRTSPAPSRPDQIACRRTFLRRGTGTLLRSDSVDPALRERAGFSELVKTGAIQRFSQTR